MTNNNPTGSGDMVERVARALHQAHAPWCDYTYRFEDPMSSRHVYEALARAAIEAMREPTEAMLEAAFDATLPEGHPDQHPDDVDNPDVCWRAMISAALTPAPRTPTSGDEGE